MAGYIKGKQMSLHRVISNIVELTISNVIQSFFFQKIIIRKKMKERERSQIGQHFLKSAGPIILVRQVRRIHSRKRCRKNPTRIHTKKLKRVGIGEAFSLILNDFSRFKWACGSFFERFFFFPKMYLFYFYQFGNKWGKWGKIQISHKEKTKKAVTFDLTMNGWSQHGSISSISKNVNFFFENSLSKISKRWKKILGRRKEGNLTAKNTIVFLFPQKKERKNRQAANSLNVWT